MALFQAILLQLIILCVVKAIPDGAVTAATNQADFEFCPSYNLDGTSIVQSTWNDRTFSQVQILSLDNQGVVSSISNMSLPTGRYGRPRFSPKNAGHVILERYGPSSLSGDTFGVDPGIYLAYQSSNG
jgi:hypothetical protein